MITAANAKQTTVDNIASTVTKTCNNIALKIAEAIKLGVYSTRFDLCKAERIHIDEVCKLLKTYGYKVEYKTFSDQRDNVDDHYLIIDWS